MEDVETETHRDSSKGVETETKTESLVTHWSGRCLEGVWKVSGLTSYVVKKVLDSIKNHN